jgi:tetratricopeptide (TPR) repeat protein
MKKLMCLLSFFLIAGNADAQNKFSDSLKMRLSKTTSAIDSFSILVKISEHNFVLGGGAVDTTTVIHLLSIAQELAFYYGVATDFYMAPSKALPQLKIAPQTAIEMDSSLADAYAYLGLYNQWYVWNFPKAEEDFKKALELGPNVYLVHWSYNIYLISTGQTQAAKKIAERLTELDPMSAEAHAWYGSVFYFARQYDEGLVHINKSLTLDQNYPFAHYFKSMCFIAQGKFSELLSETRNMRLNTWIKLLMNVQAGWYF